MRKSRLRVGFLGGPGCRWPTWWSSVRRNPPFPKFRFQFVGFHTFKPRRRRLVHYVGWPKVFNCAVCTSRGILMHGVGVALITYFIPVQSYLDSLISDKDIVALRLMWSPKFETFLSCGPRF